MPCILDNVGTILQARRQEMKWAVCLKKWKMGVFCKKVKNEECFFCKKVDLSSTQGALCTVSLFF